MSVEVITILLSSLGTIITLGSALAAGFAWMVRRMDAGDERLGARIDAVDEKLTAHIDSVEEKLTARIDAVAADLVEVKLTVARIDERTKHAAFTTR